MLAPAKLRLAASSIAAFVFVVPLAAAQVATAWSAPTSGVAVAVDDANNVFTVSYVQALGGEMTLTKRDVNGALSWEASHDQTDSTKWERAQFVATDGDGNCFVIGTMMSGYSNPVTAASIAMKFAPDGSLLWRHFYESSFDGSQARRALVDEGGNLYVLGMGSGPNGYVTKVKKFAPDGSSPWTWFDGDGIGAAFHCKFAPNGDLLISGRSIFGSIDGYARIDRNGQKVFAFPGVPSLTVGDLAGDSLGNTYLVHGEYVLNGGSVVKKLDPTGALLFEQVYPLSAFRIEVGNDDQAVICGFPNPNAPGAAFLKLDTNGNVLWSNPDADGPLGLLLHARLVLDDSNDAYLAAGTLFEMAVCKVNADGTSAWTKTLPGSYANWMELSRNDQGIFVTGGQTARLLDPAEGPWLDLGESSSTLATAPNLVGSGSLVAGTPLGLGLEHGPAFGVAWLVLGASRVDIPLLGGTLVPSFDVVLPIVLDASGAWHLAAPAPSLPPQLDVYLQAWMQDPAGLFGITASNGLRTTTP
jgi:hypothetical protein